jgi:hypothetical protein
MQTSRAAGESVLAREYQRVVTRAFSKLSQSQEDTGLEAVRRIVSDSWQRSLSALPPTGRDSARVGLDTDELRRLRTEGPLARALPIVRRLLIEPARDTGLVVAIGDAQGRLLWVEGDHQSLRRTESMGFAVGADWSETAMGTSAPGIVVATGAPASVAQAEHFSPVVREWSCTAVPLVDPHTRALMGVLDITGGDEAVSPLSLPLLTAAAAAIEAELAQPGPDPDTTTTVFTGVSFGDRPGPADGPLPAEPPLPDATAAEVPVTSQATGTSAGGDAGPDGAVPGDPGLGGVGPSGSWPGAAAPLDHAVPEPAVLPPVVRVTGSGAPTVTRDGRERQIGLRHAEILTLLDWHDDGLTGPQLGEMAYEEAPEAATVRVEMHRLRRVLGEATGGEVELASRPYRLVGTQDREWAPLTDVRAAHDALTDGDVVTAVRLCRGLVLPSSTAPEIEGIRTALATSLREAVLQFADHDLLWTYLRRQDAQDDQDAWMLALRLLPADDVRRAAAVARLDAIDAENAAR